jgi:shikimate kinase
MSIVFLIGMPAAGKTYWGTRVADAFNLPFIDLDTFIEQREHQSIPDLFARGEGWFRAKEHAALIALISIVKRPTIVATGGGTPCFFNNLKQMHRVGITVYLRTEISTLVARAAADEETRPLLRGKHNATAVLQQMLKERERYYNQANFILQSENISLSTFEEIIRECTNRHSQQGLSLQW